MARKRIGELLLERGVITVPQLEEGLALHRQTRQRLGVALIQKGFVTEEQLVQVLSEALSIPTVDLKSVTPDWGAVHMLRARFCESNDLFPFALEALKGRKQLVVAMSDPLNLAAIEEIEFTTGLKCNVRLATLSAIRAAILRYYHKVNPDDSAGDGKMTIIQRGGAGVRVVDTNTHKGDTLDEDGEVIVGEELPPGEREVTARTALADLIKKREEQHRAAKAKGKAKPAGGAASVSKDLDYLFGVSGDEEAVEKLERKFWALMRVMARKGLITNEEFKKELDEED